MKFASGEMRTSRPNARLMSSRPLGAIFVLALFSLVVACGRHGATHATAAGSSTAIPTDASGSRGARIFAAQCSVCHGVGGGGGPIGPALKGRTKLSKALIVAAIEHARPPMPKLYPGVLSPQDVADLAAYIGHL